MSGCMPSIPLDLAILITLVLAAAVLYSSGGHAGASAYLALMAFFSVAPAVMRPTALVMNIAVASIGSTRFIRARAVPWHLLRPLCLGSIPAAFAGGRIRLAPGTYLLVLGTVLLAAAFFLWLRPKSPMTRKPPSRILLIAIGCALGFVAGLTGIGGGIFLSPLLILTGWEEPRRTSGAAAVFILVNSVLGLLGQLSSLVQVPPQAALLTIAAVCGGLVGSWLGVHRLQALVLRRVHAVVLVISGTKLLLEGLRL
jgi:uncharacterized membrane protein YfcA